MEKEIIKFPSVQGVSVIDRKTPEYFPPHWHNASEFTLILKDNCVYKIKDEIYHLNSGDILLIWPRELHEILSSPKEGSVFIQFSADIIENNLDLVSASKFMSACHVISAKKEPETAQILRDIIYEIGDIYSKKPSFSETKCKILIYRLLLVIGDYVMREQHEQNGPATFSTTSRNYIRSACNYIAEHSMEDISQAEVAAKIGLSPYYFSKLFKEYLQTSFPQYLTRIRLQNAITLLTEDSLSITECAYMAGFQSTTTFNKVFLESVGCSPREYRKLQYNQQ
ncbi:MAG: AraC family transcriptional regulator [Lachnospiraceae bacterium]|nr:AraC family transcriptional regulator [Lachnospiraceae bacterium]